MQKNTRFIYILVWALIKQGTLTKVNIHLIYLSYLIFVLNLNAFPVLNEVTVQQGLFKNNNSKSFFLCSLRRNGHKYPSSVSHLCVFLLVQSRGLLVYENWKENIHTLPDMNQKQLCQLGIWPKCLQRNVGEWVGRKGEHAGQKEKKTFN